MRILVLGGGAREHAIVWKLARNPTVDKIYAAPGNAGIAEVAECVKLDPTDRESVAEFAESRRVDLTVVGPEAPLVAGVADEFVARGLAVFGPTRLGARIESSKSWAKDLMRAAGVATAVSGTFDNVAEALAFVEEMRGRCVVKADGLAAGKGVLICENVQEAESALRACLEDLAFGEAGSRVVVEEFLQGRELSVFCITDGRDVLPLAEARDFKRAFDGDAGPNTGGMGAYSPVPDAAGAVSGLAGTVFKPVVDALDAEGIRYVGVLYAGFMLTAGGAKVLEFNARFGDPETQVVIPRLDSDLGELFLAAAEGNIGVYKPIWKPEACVGIVLASANYPEPSPVGFPIAGLRAVEELPGVEVFHAGTALLDGEIVTAGGRVLTVAALGRDLREARARAYEAAQMIQFEGVRMRTDIAATAAGEG